MNKDIVQCRRCERSVIADLGEDAKCKARQNRWQKYFSHWLCDKCRKEVVINSHEERR